MGSVAGLITRVDLVGGFLLGRGMKSHGHYDQRYFDKWYRDPKHKVSTAGALRRKAAMVVGVAEYYLEREIRTVLDVGCGEGQWQPVLRKMRPRVKYLGIDPSAYAVERFGKRRNLRQGTFAQLAEMDLAGSYDLVICSNALYYIPAEELEIGLWALAPRIGGVAFLEAYDTETPLKGDTRNMERRNAAAYRKLFRRHGLKACGSHCYVGEALAECVTELERGGV